jgi:hypothetical protein
MRGLVYIAANTNNGKVYVGQGLTEFKPVEMKGLDAT